MVSWFPVRREPCHRRAALDDCVVENQSDRKSGAEGGVEISHISNIT